MSRDVPRLIGGGARQTPSLNAGKLSGEPPVLLSLGGGAGKIAEEPLPVAPGNSGSSGE